MKAAIDLILLLVSGGMVQQCLQYLGVETDHIAIRTSYRGMSDYLT
jgi:hypothetical protein